VVSVEEGKQLAKEYGIGFFETSAKNDIEVDTVCAFFSVAALPMRALAWPLQRCPCL
jgi:hypothetical protein